jgi:hypothetical protein
MTTAAEITALQVGDELTPMQRKALMKPPPGGHKWGSPHQDKYAREVLGLRGGLVPGVSTMAYVEEMLGRYFGPSWLERGSLEVRFVGGGAIQDDDVTARARVTARERDDDGERLDLEVWLEDANIDGKAVVVGTASYRI